MYLFDEERGTVWTLPTDAHRVLAELFPQLEEDDGSPSRPDQGRLPFPN